jgi:single-stranded DNA-specific DHH superfamily exonuclease
MPFGYTNPAPVFLAERVYLKRPPRTVGKNHLRLGLTQKPFTRQAIGFNMGNLAESLSMNLSFNVAYSLEIDVRLPAAEQQLRICDIQFPYSFEPSDDDF